MGLERVKARPGFPRRVEGWERGRAITAESPAPEVDTGSPVASSGEESAATDYETAMVESKSPTEDEPVATDPHAVAAE
jgi:hypothetical protein